jgi:hypothetical protein
MTILIIVDLDKFISVTVDGWCLGGVSQEYYGGPTSLLFLWCVWDDTEERWSTEHIIQDITTR